ncbi:hypothetical protein R3P38DRAFT_3231326 [Favolaschia claudopus]|uniref:Uncharacterized protein n=1 Tax=Favolaschia claudopus TaxID=2862362 RepID=A0AAV9ZKA0_9AGAR
MASGPRRSPRKHTQPKKASKKAPAKKTRSKKQAEPPLPPIDWVADEYALVWVLVGRMEVKENRLVLFGKDSTDDHPMQTLRLGTTSSGAGMPQCLQRLPCVCLFHYPRMLLARFQFCRYLCAGALNPHTATPSKFKSAS